MASRAPFRLGLKEIHLPNFTVTLLRTARLPPTFARFEVPLSMNKLDLRDYLYHAYNVRTLGIRSYVEQQPVRQGKPGAIKPTIKRWFRPRAIKRMTVEMDKPFVWPAVPEGEDLAPWNPETFRASQKENEEYANRRGRLADTMYSQKDRDELRVQAKSLLEGKEKWRPGMEKK
ncbi:hypothetical protein AAFC00_007082 [Neodothiora populina]|uniref:Large ribosomal subunit protein uL23m n=1 Tax=Neodothiora populina TaxID=2781224 RepID=A0ABR3PC48_9PEZI